VKASILLKFFRDGASLLLRDDYRPTHLGTNWLLVLAYDLTQDIICIKLYQLERVILIVLTYAGCPVAK